MAITNLPDFSQALTRLHGALTDVGDAEDALVARNTPTKPLFVDLLTYGGAAQMRRARRKFACGDWAAGTAQGVGAVGLSLLAPLPLWAFTPVGFAVYDNRHQGARSAEGLFEDQVVGRQNAMLEQLQMLQGTSTVKRLLDSTDPLSFAEVDEALNDLGDAQKQLKANLPAQIARVRYSAPIAKRLHRVDKEIASAQRSSADLRQKINAATEHALATGYAPNARAVAATGHGAPENALDASNACDAPRSEPQAAHRSLTLTLASAASERQISIDPEAVASHSAVLAGLLECPGPVKLMVGNLEAAQIAIEAMHGEPLQFSAAQWAPLFEVLDYWACAPLLEVWKGATQGILSRANFAVCLDGVSKMNDSGVRAALFSKLYGFVRDGNLPLSALEQRQLLHGAQAYAPVGIGSRVDGGRLFHEDTTAANQQGESCVQLTWWPPALRRGQFESTGFPLGGGWASLRLGMDAAGEADLSIRWQRLPDTAVKLHLRLDDRANMAQFTKLSARGQVNNTPVNSEVFVRRQWDSGKQRLLPKVDSLAQLFSADVTQRQVNFRKLDIALRVAGLDDVSL